MVQEWHLRAAVAVCSLFLLSFEANPNSGSTNNHNIHQRILQPRHHACHKYHEFNGSMTQRKRELRQKMISERTGNLCFPTPFELPCQSSFILKFDSNTSHGICICLHVFDAFDGRLRAHIKEAHVPRMNKLGRNLEEKSGNDHRKQAMTCLLHSHAEKLAMTVMDDSI